MTLGVTVLVTVETLALAVVVVVVLYVVGCTINEHAAETTSQTNVEACGGSPFTVHEAAFVVVRDCLGIVLDDLRVVVDNLVGVEEVLVVDGLALDIITFRSSRCSLRIFAAGVEVTVSVLRRG